MYRSVAKQSWKHGNYKYSMRTDLPKNVLWIKSEIWLPDLLDTASWLSSRFSSRLNCEQQQMNDDSIINMRNDD